MVVPNTKVKIRHAFIGALVASLLLEAAKAGFTWYLSSYDTYELLYGAFATVPIFFLWVYWVWFIVLLGAEVAYAFSAPHYRRTGLCLDGLTHSIHWLNYLWVAQKKGLGLSVEALIKKDELAYEIKPEIIISNLMSKKLITITDEGTFILCKNLSKLTFDKLRLLLPWQLPNYEITKTVTHNAINLKLIKNSQQALAKDFNITIDRLFEKPPLKDA